MSRGKNGVGWKGGAALLLLGFAALMAPSSFHLAALRGVGAVHAAPPVRQDGVEEPATESAAPTEDRALKGMDAVSDLAAQQSVSREFLQTVESRRREVEAREKAVKVQEEHLLLLRQDIEAKLAHLDKVRAELEAMTRQVDKTRKKDLEKAVQLYQSMGAAQAAKVLDQMDLESVVAIFREMDVETAGGILDAMAESGTDSAKMGKLKAIGESLVNAKKPKTP